jgi:uncharacterized protein (DUF1778 family)
MLQSPSPAVLSVRVSPNERVLLESAAQQARTSLSDFIRRKAIEAAEADLLDQRVVTIAADDWAKFEAWLDAPPHDKPELRALAAIRPAWQD